MANASSVRTNAAASRRGSETRCRWGRSDVAMRRWRLFRNRTVVTMSAAGAPPVHSWTNANCEAPAKMSRLIAAISIGSGRHGDHDAGHRRRDLGARGLLDAAFAWRGPQLPGLSPQADPHGSVALRRRGGQRAVDRPAMVLTRLGDATIPVPVRSGAFEPDRS